MFRRVFLGDRSWSNVIPLRRRGRTSSSCTAPDIGRRRLQFGAVSSRKRRSPEESVALLSDRDARDVRTQLASLTGSVTLVNFHDRRWRASIVARRSSS